MQELMKILMKIFLTRKTLKGVSPPEKLYLNFDIFLIFM